MPPHDVLQVAPGASRGEIVDAFRRFALVHHPDRGGDPAQFRAGVDAYQRLVGSSGGGPPIMTGRSDVVFHRRARPGIPTLVRLARHRLAAFRFRS